nr:MAG TPA: Baseplate wedge protein [Herelleviridae sp.]
MRYKKHEVRYNDTMQSISQRYYSTPEYWIDLVEHNNLKYPYIVDEAEDKLKDPEHLVTTGDELVIPQESYLSDYSIKEINKNDKDRLVDMALGSDLNITSDSKYFNKYGTSDEIMAFSENVHGDLDTVRGVENMKQQLINKLMTPKGSLLLHPEYGSNIHELFQKSIPETGLLIELEITRTLLTDSRVKSVQTISWRIEENKFYGEFDVELTSIEESVKLVLEEDSSGVFALFD